METVVTTVISIVSGGAPAAAVAAYFLLRKKRAEAKVTDADAQARVELAHAGADNSLAAYWQTALTRRDEDYRRDRSEWLAQVAELKKQIAELADSERRCAIESATLRATVDQMKAQMDQMARELIDLRRVQSVAVKP